MQLAEGVMPKPFRLTRLSESVVRVPVVVSFGGPPAELGISSPYSTGTCHMARLWLGGTSHQFHIMGRNEWPQDRKGGSIAHPKLPNPKYQGMSRGAWKRKRSAHNDSSAK